MKVLICILLSAFCTVSWSRTITITQPTEGMVISSASETVAVTVKGTVDSVTGGAGTVICNNVAAAFGTGLNWMKSIPLTAPGINTIACTYTKDGETATASVSVNWVANDKPESIFSPSKYNEAPNEVINFDGSESYDTNGTISSYNWEFGDGTTGNGPIVNHSFTAPGEYLVKLKVTDNNGGFKTSSKTILIGDFTQLTGNMTTLAPTDPLVLQLSDIPLEQLQYDGFVNGQSFILYKFSENELVATFDTLPPGNYSVVLIINGAGFIYDFSMTEKFITADPKSELLKINNFTASLRNELSNIPNISQADLLKLSQYSTDFNNALRQLNANDKAYVISELQRYYQDIYNVSPSAYVFKRGKRLDSSLEQATDAFFNAAGFNGCLAMSTAAAMAGSYAGGLIIVKGALSGPYGPLLLGISALSIAVMYKCTVMYHDSLPVNIQFLDKITSPVIKSDFNFVSGERKSITFMGEFRNLNKNDIGNNSIGENLKKIIAATSAQETFYKNLRLDLVLEPFSLSEVDEIRVSAPIDPVYITSLTSDNNDVWSGDIFPSGDSSSAIFFSNLSTAFNFEARYVNPGWANVTETFSAYISKPAATFNAFWGFGGDDVHQISLTCIDETGHSGYDTSDYAICDWDFGDGTFGTGFYVTHTYTSLGTYTFKVTVTKNDGAIGYGQFTFLLNWLTRPEYVTASH